MGEHEFSAKAFIAWIRMCRPGSVLGPQQNFLLWMEHELNSYRCSTSRGVVPPHIAALQGVDTDGLARQMTELSLGEAKNREDSANVDSEFCAGIEAAVAAERHEDAGQGERLCEAKLRNHKKRLRKNRKSAPARISEPSPEPPAEDGNCEDRNTSNVAEPDLDLDLPSRQVTTASSASTATSSSADPDLDLDPLSRQDSNRSATVDDDDSEGKWSESSLAGHVYPSPPGLEPGSSDNFSRKKANNVIGWSCDSEHREAHQQVFREISELLENRAAGHNGGVAIGRNAWAAVV